MHRLILLASGIFFAHASFGAIVHDARLDASQQNLLVDVTYSGGCVKQHDFSLKLHGCAERLPPDCSADLIDRTFDACEMAVQTTVVLPLAKFGLNDKYYKRASLSILGDKDASGERSVARTRLP